MADIADEGLIGADFLGTYRCYLNMSDYTVQLTLSNGATVVVRCSGSSSSTVSRRLVRTVRTTEAIRLEGWEETLLAASTFPGRGNRWSYQIVPLPDTGRTGSMQRAFSAGQLQVMPSETSGLADEILIQVMNLSTKTYVMLTRMAMAECVVMPVQPKLPEVTCSARDKLPRSTRDDKLPEVTRGARDDKLPWANRDDKLPEVTRGARDDKLPRATRDAKLPEVTRGARDDKLPRANGTARDDRLPRTVRFRKAGRGTQDKQPPRGTEVTRSRATEESLGSEGSELPDCSHCRRKEKTGQETEDLDVVPANRFGPTSSAGASPSCDASSSCDAILQAAR